MPFALTQPIATPAAIAMAADAMLCARMTMTTITNAAT
jgi:hypothetical protein